MPDTYINREAVRRETCKGCTMWGGGNICHDADQCEKLIAAFLNAPAADVAEVVHGEWLRADDDWNSLTTIQCSLCGEEWCFETDDDVSLLNYKYCPNCGARMDGGDGT